MSQISPEPSATQEEVLLAESAEQELLTEATRNAQQQYLLRRVVTLRIQSDRFQQQLEAAKAEIATLRESLDEQAVYDDGPTPD